jgi:hypothetical protein
MEILGISINTVNGVRIGTILNTSHEFLFIYIQVLVIPHKTTCHPHPTDLKKIHAAIRNSVTKSSV